MDPVQLHTWKGNKPCKTRDFTHIFGSKDFKDFQEGTCYQDTHFSIHVWKDCPLQGQSTGNVHDALGLVSNLLLLQQ